MCHDPWSWVDELPREKIDSLKCMLTDFLGALDEEDYDLVYSYLSGLSHKLVKSWWYQLDSRSDPAMTDSVVFFRDDKVVKIYPYPPEVIEKYHRIHDEVSYKGPRHILGESNQQFYHVRALHLGDQIQKLSWWRTGAVIERVRWDSLVNDLLLRAQVLEAINKACSDTNLQIPPIHHTNMRVSNWDIMITDLASCIPSFLYINGRISLEKKEELQKCKIRFLRKFLRHRILKRLERDVVT